MDDDFYLHNDHPLYQRHKRSYRNWFSPQNIAPKPDNKKLDISDDYYTEYYRPRVYTSFKRLFSFNMLGTNTKGPLSTYVSPFTIRVNPHQQQKQFMMYSLNIGGVKRWLALDKEPGEHGEDVPLDDDALLTSREYMESPAMMEDIPKARDDQEWYGTAALSTRLLQPQVPETELKEYERYTQQFQTSSTQRSATIPANYGYYVSYLGNDSGVGSETAKRDEQMYQNHVAMAKSRSVKRTVKKEASYRAYMETGVFVLPKKVRSEG